MAYDGAGSIYALQLRVTKLAPDGSVVAGPAGMIVTESLVRIEIAGAFDDPQRIERKNGAGKLCVSYQPPPTLKQVDISALEVCSPDPELDVLLAGGVVLTDGGETVGEAWPAIGENPTPDGVSIEAWSRAIINGAPAADRPYIHWVLPRTYLRRGNIALEEGATGPGFTGYGIENSQWGDGPAGDWEHASDRCVQWARVAALPDLTDGLVAIPAQV